MTAREDQVPRDEPMSRPVMTAATEPKIDQPAFDDEAATGESRWGTTATRPAWPDC